MTEQEKAEFAEQLDRLAAMSDEQRQAVLGYVWRDVPAVVRSAAIWMVAP